MMETSTHSESNGSWKSITLVLITALVVALIQWATLGFSVPSRQEVSSAIAVVKSDNDKKVQSLDEKLDAIKSDIETLKIQAERTNTLMEAYQRQRRGGENQ